MITKDSSNQGMRCVGFYGMLIFVTSLQDDYKDSSMRCFGFSGMLSATRPLLERISISDIYPKFQPELVVDSFDGLSEMEIRS
jgi:hypothetical protein